MTPGKLRDVLQLLHTLRLSNRTDNVNQQRDFDSPFPQQDDWLARPASLWHRGARNGDGTWPQWSWKLARLSRWRSKERSPHRRRDCRVIRIQRWRLPQRRQIDGRL